MLKDKKIQKRLKQLQNAILQAVASFDRVCSDETKSVNEATSNMFTDKKLCNEMIENIVNRVSVLVTEYRKVLEQKTLIMKKAVECITRLDSAKCPLDMALPLSSMSEL